MEVKSGAAGHERAESSNQKVLERALLSTVHRASCDLRTLVKAFVLYLKAEFIRGEEVKFVHKPSETGIISGKERQPAKDPTTATEKSPNSVEPTRNNKENSEGADGNGLFTYNVHLSTALVQVKGVTFNGLRRVNEVPDEAAIRKWILTYSTMPSGDKPWTVVEEKVTEHALRDTPYDFYIKRVIKLKKESKEKKKMERKHSHGEDLNGKKSISTSSKKNLKKLLPNQKTLDDMFKMKPSNNSGSHGTNPSFPSVSVSLFDINSSNKGKDTLSSKSAKLSSPVKVVDSDTDDDAPLSKIKVPENHKTSSNSVSKSSKDRSKGKKKHSSKNSKDHDKSKSHKHRHNSGEKRKHHSPDMKHSKHEPLVKKHKLSDSPIKKHKLSDSPSKKHRHRSSSLDGPHSEHKKQKHSNNSGSPSKRKHSLNDKLDGSSKKHKSKHGEKDKSSKKKKMKQMTLLQMGKPGCKVTMESLFDAPKKPRIPRIAKRYEQAVKDNNRRGMIHLISKAAALPSKEIEVLPEEMRELVLEKVAQLELRNKLKSMTPEEQKAYLAQRRQERIKEKKKLLQKSEDTTLNLEPLPEPRLLTLPDTLAESCFGDVAFVSTFLNTFKELIMADSAASQPIHITIDVILESLTDSLQGVNTFAQILSSITSILVNEESFEDVQWLGVKLTSITCNQNTAPQILWRAFEGLHEDDATSDSAVDREPVMASELKLLTRDLSNVELAELPASLKFSLLQALCEQLLQSTALQNFVIDKRGNASKAWRDRGGVRSMGQQIRTLSKEIEQLEKEAKEREESEAQQAATGPDGEALNGSPDLVQRVKSRRFLSALEQEKKEKAKKAEKILLEKQIELAKLEKAESSIQKNFLEATTAVKEVERQQPLGVDRYHSRYWYFNSQPMELYVEKGWGNYGYNSSSHNEDEFVDIMGDPPVDIMGEPPVYIISESPEDMESIPPKVPYGWAVYEGREAIEHLLTALTPKGVRESPLIAAIKEKVLKPATEVKTTAEGETTPAEFDPWASLKSDLAEFNSGLVAGGLGGLVNMEGEAVVDGETKDDLVHALLGCQESIVTKYLKGIMAPPENTSSDVVKAKADAKDGLASWQEAVTMAATSSQLHFLLNILEDGCVRWEKSLEKVKCKVCRKKGAGQMALCDGCGLGFHLHCVRPALAEVPEGTWLCVACQPLGKRKRAVRDYFENNDSDGDEPEEEDEDMSGPEELCCVCSQGGEIFGCQLCGDCYHTRCHQPSLRRVPRNAWTCEMCKNGGKRTLRSRKRQKTVAAVESSSDSSDSDASQSSDESE